MASAALLRSFSKGSPLLLRPHSCLLRPDVTGKSFTVTPASSAALDYFRARRGPFTPAEKQGKHMLHASTQWKIERINAVSMIGVMPAALVFAGPAMDFVLTMTVFMHGFWGLDHVLSDYVRKFVPWCHKLWYFLSICAFAGLMHFNFNDVGVTQAVAMLWKM